MGCITAPRLFFSNASRSFKIRLTGESFYTVPAKGKQKGNKVVTQVVKQEAKQSSPETRLLKEVIENLSCDDPEARRKALDAVMVFAWRPGWKPTEFVSLGGIPALIGKLEEDDEKNRVQAVSAIDRLADLGAASDLVKEGVLPLLERMAAGDRYEQLRMMAGRAAAKIRGKIKVQTQDTR
jgi:hypothetical protein